jgi:hypothetical protein
VSRTFTKLGLVLVLCLTTASSPLPTLGITSLSLDYWETGRRDRFGNLLRYRAKVNIGETSIFQDSGRWAYDVFLRTVGTP